MVTVTFVLTPWGRAWPSVRPVLGLSTLEWRSGQCGTQMGNRVLHLHFTEHRDRCDHVIRGSHDQRPL